MHTARSVTHVVQANQTERERERQSKREIWIGMWRSGLREASVWWFCVGPWFVKILISINTRQGEKKIKWLGYISNCNNQWVGLKCLRMPWIWVDSLNRNSLTHFQYTHSSSVNCVISMHSFLSVPVHTVHLCPRPYPTSLTLHLYLFPYPIPLSLPRILQLWPYPCPTPLPLTLPIP